MVSIHQDRLLINHLIEAVNLLQDKAAKRSNLLISVLHQENLLQEQAAKLLTLAQLQVKLVSQFYAEPTATQLPQSSHLMFLHTSTLHNQKVQ